jgi:hypothetical protein
LPILKDQAGAEDAMRFNALAPNVFVVIAFAATPLHGQLTSPQVGWQATLSTLAHNVSGTVTIVDEDTLRVDDFTYDGGGLSVNFYLGTEESRPAFAAGLQVGPQLLGHLYTGGEPPLVIDLRAGETLEGWHAVTVWCVDVGVSFGQGTFVAVAAAGDFNGDGVVDGADFLQWQRGESPGPLSASDLAKWRANYGMVAPPSAPSVAVAEPASALLLMLAVVAVRRRDRPATRRVPRIR